MWYIEEVSLSHLWFTLLFLQRLVPLGRQQGEVAHICLLCLRRGGTLGFGGKASIGQGKEVKTKGVASAAHFQPKGKKANKSSGSDSEVGRLFNSQKRIVKQPSWSQQAYFKTTRVIKTH